MARHTWAQEAHSRRLTNSGWPLFVSKDPNSSSETFCICSSNFNLISHACRLSNQLYETKRTLKSLTLAFDKLLPTWTERARSEYSAPSHVAHVHVNLITVVVVAVGHGFLFLSNSLLCLNDRLLLSPTSCYLPIDKCYM